MNFINYLLDASKYLFTWNLNDQDFDVASRNKACLIAGIDLEDMGDGEDD
jgi:hypothetical protein